MARRLLQYGENVLQRRGGRQWRSAALVRQFTHPLVLLWVAAGLLLMVGSNVVAAAAAAAVVLIIVLNAASAFVQELQAGRAVEALAKYLPQRPRSSATVWSPKSMRQDAVLIRSGIGAEGPFERHPANLLLAADVLTPADRCSGSPARPRPRHRSDDETQPVGRWPASTSNGAADGIT